MPRYSPLYRVFPWIANAEVGEPGHPLYVGGPQGQGRVDNPEVYRTLYACDAGEGAIGEAFGNHDVWTPDLFRGPSILPGSVRAVAEIDASDAEVVDLDDAAALLERGLRPSQVVTRTRSVTQGWALAIFREGRWGGVRWWSYHDPEWGSFGLWHVGGLRVTDVRPLSGDVDAVRDIAARMNRLWDE